MKWGDEEVSDLLALFGEASIIKPYWKEHI